jgi:two-component system OmpR family response regulator
MDLASNRPPEAALAFDQPAPRPLRRPNVLLVDDDEATSRTLVHLLRLGGFDAHFVLTGAEALSHALTAAPDAIILDLHLANGDIPGFVVLKSLRAKYHALPVIVVTGWYLSDEHEAEG